MIGGIQARQGAQEPAPLLVIADNCPAISTSAPLVDDGFAATAEDRSNDTGFVVTAEDRSHDAGFAVCMVPATPSTAEPLATPMSIEPSPP